MPNIYKLEFATKEALNANLISKGILTQEGQYTERTHAIVHLGNIILEPETEETEAVISDKSHADIMVEGEFDFGENDVTTIASDNPAHEFAV